MRRRWRSAWERWARFFELTVSWGPRLRPTVTACWRLCCCVLMVTWLGWTLTQRGSSHLCSMMALGGMGMFSRRMAKRWAVKVFCFPLMWMLTRP